jgi:hypothetical protein
VKIGGDCAALEPGAPADRPPQPSRAAEQAIDLDPPNKALSAACRFRGVARGRYDVYRCRVRYFDTRMVMDLIHDRRSPSYEFRILRQEGGQGQVPETHGVCNPTVAERCQPLP